MNQSRIWVTFAAFGLILVLSPVVLAASALNLSLTPLTQDLTAGPGESVTGTLDITNEADDVQTYYPVARDFTHDPSSEGGEPQIIEETFVDNPTGVASWLTFTVPSLTVSPGGTARLQYTIAVPTDAAPGGHYGAVFVSTQPDAAPSTSGVSIQGSAGSLVFLTVDGTITVTGSAARFEAVDSAGRPRSIFSSSPIGVKLSLRNTGTVHLTPTGTLTIAKAGAVLATQEFPAEGRVLPNSLRTYSTTVNDELGYGRFSADAEVTLAAPTGQTILVLSETTFWILPVAPIVLALLGLLVGWILFRLWIRRHDATLRNQVKR